MVGPLHAGGPTHIFENGVLYGGKADPFQIIKCGIVKLGWAGWIFGVAWRDDDHHALAGAC